MAVFLLSYDLRNEAGHEYYHAFWAELSRLGAHRVLEGACMVNLNTENPRQVVETLKKLTDDSDRVVAVRMEPGNYWYLNAYPKTNDWLSRNAPAAMVPPAQTPLDS
ncbi:hypothetical protein [Rhodosalinus sp. FB01]|uniref:hypothetical protein n=1 Tax=Rhodosalinus sp. FB01 TaxID=3239194 RepID=UPI0035241FAD